jgi:hypothetical protein
MGVPNRERNKKSVPLASHIVNCKSGQPLTPTPLCLQIRRMLATHKTVAHLKNSYFLKNKK